MESLNITPEVLPVIAAAIVQVLKQIPFFKDRTDLLPIVSVAVGIGLTYAMSLAKPIVTGIVIGLVASGGFDLLQTRLQQPKHK